MRFGWLLLCSAMLLAACGDESSNREAVEYWWAPAPVVKPDESKEYAPILLPPARHALPDVVDGKRMWSTVINLTSARRIHWKAWEFDLAEEGLDREVLSKALVDAVKRYTKPPAFEDPLRAGQSNVVMLIHADAGARWDDVKFICSTLSSQPLFIRRFALAVRTRDDHDRHWPFEWERLRASGTSILTVPVIPGRNHAVWVAAVVLPDPPSQPHPPLPQPETMGAIPGPVDLTDRPFLARANAAWSQVERGLRALTRDRTTARVDTRLRDGVADGAWGLVTVAHIVTTVDILSAVGVETIASGCGDGHLVFEAAPKVPAASR